MIELYKENIIDDGRRSSKGNQLKWLDDGVWYKADYTGYEGLSEYTVSNLLALSDLQSEEYIDYETEQIKYNRVNYLGCKSSDFLKKGWQLITLERLFINNCGEGLNKCLYRINDVEERLKFLVEQTSRITGLMDFGKYMAKVLTIDAFFLNEDRHTHNLAVILDDEGNYRYCPIFDNGAALLSDTTIDYPLGEDVEILMKEATAKTFSKDFDEQLDIAEKLFGENIHFSFNMKDVECILDNEKNYDDVTKERILEIVRMQRRKYSYLFE